MAGPAPVPSSAPAGTPVILVASPRVVCPHLLDGLLFSSPIACDRPFSRHLPLSALRCMMNRAWVLVVGQGYWEALVLCPPLPLGKQEPRP